MPYVPDVSDTLAGRRQRARAYAQHLARVRLRKAHEEEYAAYYREEVERLFRERGLGVPHHKTWNREAAS